MPGCLSRCTAFSRNTIDEAWEDIRGHFGPVTNVGSSVYQSDISYWTEWATNNGILDPLQNTESNVSKFGYWLIWKCSYGTNDYGNLPGNKTSDHEGISCIPCPYDIVADGMSVDSWQERTLLWTGESSVSNIDHGNNYMKVSRRGNSWGFECTFSGCTYLLDNGIPYFHV